MRGKQLVELGEIPAVRITPAHAGKTFSNLFAFSLYADHPRACGENNSGKRARACGKGSPPRMRGKRKHGMRSAASGRITPAGAGKTQQRLTQRHNQRDHPRRCGENSLLMQGSCDDAGSPPQVRGKRNICTLREDHNGITPAGAGKTFVMRFSRAETRDHPRRCGENISPLSVHKSV